MFITNVNPWEFIFSLVFLYNEKINLNFWTWILGITKNNCDLVCTNGTYKIYHESMLFIYEKFWYSKNL